MSLQVWLPLTKDLRQQGLSTMTFTNTDTSNIVLDNAGKLGKCYKRTTKQTSGRIISNSIINLNGDISICCWAKVTDGVGDTANGLVSNHSHVDNTGFGLCVKYISNTDYRICCSTGNGSSRTFHEYYGTSNIKDAWHHLTLTYNNTTHQFQLWVDGVVEKTQSYTNASKADYIALFEWSTTYDSTSYRPACSLNDVRIYDHCLSPMEVKELAKGLVLHYPLNRNGWGQENLASQYVMPGGNSPGTISTAGRTNYYGDYGIIIPATENVDTYFSIWYNTPLESGKTYTLSAQVSGLLNGSYYNFPLFAQNNSSMGLFKIDHNGLVSLTFTMNYTGTIATYTIDNKTHYRMFMDDITRSIASGQGPITITNIKLENGEQRTPWCPNSFDTLATTMGLNSTTEYDCSGFCNNGTRTGTFTWTSDTPKYAVSTYMPKTALITHPRPVFGGVDQEWSCAVWFKLDNISQASQYLNNFNLGNIILSSTTSLLYLNSGTNDYYMYGKKAITANEWTHIVFVFRNSDALRNVYINGELSNNYGPNKTSTPCGISDTVTVGTNLAGYISDYRVYATALSADDVKSLYQNAAYIDSSGNVYGAVHTEV